MEPNLKQTPYFRCQKGNDSIPLCQKCETCILAWKIFSTKEWFQRVSDMTQRRFLVSILLQLNSLYLLHYFQNILQTTQGKDFIYHRSRISLSRLERKKEKSVKSSLNQLLEKTAEEKMKEILYWFCDSTYWTKANFTVFLLQMCNEKLLLTAARVVRVLFLREWNKVSVLHPDSIDMLFFPKKGYTTISEFPHVYWATKPRTMSFPLYRTSAKKDTPADVGKVTGRQHKKLFHCISETNKLLPKKPGMLKLEDDPCSLLVDMKAVRRLSSGCSKYRDFIRLLPIHLSKYILRMLDKNSLNKCISVNQHWASLAQQVKMELSMHTFLQNQITILQGSYTKGIDPNYANKLLIPVPKMTDDGKRMRAKTPKWKLRTKSDYSLWTAYQNQETQMVQMEERNVFCGTYNIRIISDTWDRNRIIHYSGGNLIAVASNRKMYLLDILQVKELRIEFRGHAGSVRTIFLAEKEMFLLSGSYDLSIRYWDLKTGSCIKIFYGHQGTITCMDVYKNKLASGAKDGQVKEWELDSGKCLKTFKHKDPISAIKISETYIVSTCEKGLIKVWHIANTQLVKTLMGHEGIVRCLFFDEWHLVSGGADGLVMAWSMVGKYERCLMAFKHPKEVLQVSLLYLRVISACADGKIRIYNFLNGNCLKLIKVEAKGDPVLSFFYHGNRMVVNTVNNILMFHFENVKWQYAQERTKLKKKEKEEEKEEINLDIVSKSNIRLHNLKESGPSKHTEIQELQSKKTSKSRGLEKLSKSASAVSTETTESQGKDKSSLKYGKKTGVKDIVQENLGAECKDEDSILDMKTSIDLINQSKKKSWKIPMTPDRFLLTVNALQKAHNSEEFAYPHRPQIQTIDDLQSSISYPRKVLNFKGKSIQHAVDKLKSSNPFLDMKQTNIPLKIQKLQPNLKNSLHSPSVQSTIPQPMIISRFYGSLSKESLTSSIDGAVRSIAPLTSMQVIKSNRILVPQISTSTLPLKKERPRFYTNLDPLRTNTEFMLMTVKEEKEYEEAKIKAFKDSQSTKVVDPGKKSKAAWILKTKGLPIDDFMKQGKIAAPELGENVFI
ncbi:F-box/WD repeat-containing protein 10 isoform X1 [Dipodomys merriami]|uniref:F-box/WD repeat-containing protein 10 isoform X1 n=1 Tax=Dipodomys merriami TaxID=94247 RepID=UPI003855D6B0